MKLYQAIGERILFYCKERNIKPNKLCTMSGVLQSTVNCIFSGKSQNPKIETIYSLCQGLEITLDEFFNCDLFRNIDD